MIYAAPYHLPHPLEPTIFLCSLMISAAIVGFIYKKKRVTRSEYFSSFVHYLIIATKGALVNYAQMGEENFVLFNSKHFVHPWALSGKSRNHILHIRTASPRGKTGLYWNGLGA